MSSGVPNPGEVVGYLVVFGTGLAMRALLQDRARAEQYAADAHGVCIPLIPAPLHILEEQRHVDPS